MTSVTPLDQMCIDYDNNMYSRNSKIEAKTYFFHITILICQQNHLKFQEMILIFKIY